MAAIVAATRNANKVREFSQLFRGLPFELLSLADFPGAPEVEEDAATLEGNALKKARSAALFTGLPAFGDDTGLEVEALGGGPGVYSARYAGPCADAAANNRKLLSALEGLPEEKRGASFRCVIALCLPGGAEELFEGRLDGSIGFSLSGANGFGYDPLFLLPGGRSLAELSPAEKNSVSHRGRAFGALAARLAGGPL